MYNLRKCGETKSSFMKIKVTKRSKKFAMLAKLL